MNRLSGAALFLVLAWCVTGCGKSGPSAPSVAKVKGTVNLDGKPMDGGEIRFSIPGQPPRSLEIKGGAFSGEAFIGKNVVEVVWDKDGPPNPTDPTTRMKVNTISDKFWGPNSTLSADIAAPGAEDLKFDVTSKR